MMASHLGMLLSPSFTGPGALGKWAGFCVATSMGLQSWNMAELADFNIGRFVVQVFWVLEIGILNPKPLNP